MSRIRYIVCRLDLYNLQTRKKVGKKIIRLTGLALNDNIKKAEI